MAYKIKDNIFTYITDGDDIARIDSAVFSEDMCGTFKNELSRYIKYPKELIVLYDDDEAIGYIQYFPITDEFTSKLYSDDTIHDDDITAKDIKFLRKYDFMSIYILSVALMPEYHGGEAMKKLGEAFSDTIIKLHKSGFFIRDIISTAISDKGRGTLSRFGLKNIKTLQGGYSLYACKIADFIKAREEKQ